VAASAGLDLPIYPVKGYSVTMPVLDAARAPLNGGIDEKTRVTFARLGDRVRMTTTAEFTGYDTSYSPANFAKILRVAHELFDGGIDVAKAFFWACLRPASPDGPPIIGATPVANLWLNTGHGYLGWTMSCGSAKILSDLIAGRSPEIDASPYRFSRF
jgi:D-amino-acid dehydrogenase